MIQPYDCTIDNLNDTIERLRDDLETMRDAKAKSDAKVDNLAYQLSDGVLGWSVHREWKADDLPVPRLELHLRRVKGPEGRHVESEVLYLLVRRDPEDHEGQDVTAVPLGRTRVGGGRELFRLAAAGPGTLYTPLRDGVHILRDAKHLGLPAFVTNEDGAQAALNADGSQRLLRTTHPNKDATS